MYTDGVTEAMNREKAFYSEKRLMSAVERGKSASVEALIQEVLRSVKEFTEGEAFPDDVTLLALQFKGLNATNEGGHTIAPREKK